MNISAQFIVTTGWSPYGNHTKSFLWCIFEKPQILARDVFETSQKRRLFWDMLETSYKRLTKEIFFEMFLRSLIDVAKKTSFLRCIWEVLKASQERHLFWDVSKRSLRCLSQCRSDKDLSETSHADWVKAKIDNRMKASDSKPYLSYLNKFVDQCNNTYYHSIKKTPLMLITLLWKNWY